MPLFLRLTMSSLLILMISWGLSTSSMVLVWVIMELNLLLFLPLLVFSSSLFRGVSGLKFFFIQSVGGMMLLISILLMPHTASWFMLLAASLSILLKTGGFPFHQWLINLSTEVSWDGLLILLTLQKAIPLYILSVFNSSALIPLMALSWVVLSVSGLVLKQVKKIFVVSSVFFLGALIISATLSGWGWKALLCVYFSVFASFAIMFGGEKSTTGGSPGANSTEASSSWFLIMLFLSGIPPFPAFWMKVEVVSGMVAVGEMLQSLVFILCGGVFMYIYVSLISWFVLLSASLKTSSAKSKMSAIGPLIPVFLVWSLL